MGERHGNRCCCTGAWGLHSGINTPEREPQTGEGFSARMAKDAFAVQKLNLSSDRNKESPPKAKAEGVASEVAAPVRKFPTSSLGTRAAVPDGSALRLARPCLIIGFISCHEFHVMNLHINPGINCYYYFFIPDLQRWELSHQLA